MRATVCALVAVIGLAIGLAATPALAQADRTAAAFWKSVQSTCDATAAKPAGELGRRIAKTATDEFNGFGGHRIDANGHLFHFGLTEAEHEEDDGGDRPASLGRLGWWRVMKYWRVLFGDDAADKIEVRGYGDASTSADDAKTAAAMATSVGDLMRAAATVSDPELREILREDAIRAGITDTPWSAAFISYVIRQSGVADGAFQFSNAHRAYIYDAFAASLAEQQKHDAGNRLYRACPITATKPRVGDMVCTQREPSLADASDEAVRERIRDGTHRRHRRALGPAHPLRNHRLDRCGRAQDVHHRRQCGAGRHRAEAEPPPRPEVLGLARRALRRRGALDPAAGRGRQARRGREMLAQRQEMVRAAATPVNAGRDIILSELFASSCIVPVRR